MERVYFPHAAINGQPVRMVLDTGSTDNFIESPRVAKRLGLPIELSDAIHNINGHDATVWWTKPLRIQFGADTYTSPLEVLNSDAPTLIDLSPGKFDVDIGWPAVRNNILVFDADQRTVRAVAKLPSETSSWLKLPILKNDTLLLKITLPDGTVGSLLVDTGNASGVNLAPQQWKAWRPAHPHAQVSSIKLFDGNDGTPIETVWADEIKLGALTLTDVPVSEDRMPQNFYGQDAPPDEVFSGHYFGTIGLFALERMDLVLDGKHRVAYLKPKPSPGPPYPGFDRPQPRQAAGVPAMEDWTVAPGVRIQWDTAPIK